MARSPELARLFQQPDSTTQRRYEICRAYFLEGATAQQLAQQYQLHVGTVRAIIRDFASQPDLSTFFLTEHPGRKSAPKRVAIQERACELRRQGGTLADILATLRGEGFDVSESYLFRVLRRAGLTTVRNRRTTPQPGETACDGSVVPDMAEVRMLSLEVGRRVSTRVAGLFLFLPMLLELDLPRPQTARETIQTYASRNHVENQLGEQITFFHLDCLCSDVRLNVDFDLTPTVVADLLYRSLAERLKGFARVGPARLFRKFVDTPGDIEIATESVIVRLSKRAHNPLLKEAGLTKPTRPVPWLGNRSVHLTCP
jgi:transposase